MSNRNIEKARRFANMSRRGYEPVGGSNLARRTLKFGRSKAAQSTEAAALISPGTMITKVVATDRMVNAILDDMDEPAAAAAEAIMEACR